MTAPVPPLPPAGGGPATGSPAGSPPNVEGYYANYAEYSKTLRAWLVAYGIGGPVLFLTNDKAANKLATASNAGFVIKLFLVGVVLQIAGTAVNKWAAWHVWSSLDEPLNDKGWWLRQWCRINEQTWIDMAVDGLSIGAFAWATWILLDVFLAASKAG